MIYLFGGFGVVILLLGLAVGFEHERAVSANNRADAISLQLKTAQERATALALQWSAQVDKTEAEVRKAKGDASVEIAALQDRIRKGPTRVVVFDTATASLFTDITGAANATPAPAVSDKPAVTVPDPAVAGATTAYDEREFSDYIAKAAAAYRDVRTKLTGCISLYQNFQKDSL